MTRTPALLRLLRPEQWVKNLFVAAPLVLTPAAVSLHNGLRVLGGVACFCALASAAYILNDLVDRATDRAHPVKRARPLAAGEMPVAAAVVALVALVLAGMAGAAALSAPFALVLAAYAAMSAAYSLWLKRFAIIDVVTIALGYVLRVESGGILIDITPSAWIIIMTGLLALFIALAKRRDDLVLRLGESHRPSLGGYTKPFLDAAVAVVLGALLVGYLIYTTDTAVMRRLGTERLYFTVPFVVTGILRYLQLTMVMEQSGSPTRLMLTDRMLIGAVAGWAATFAALLYL